MAQPVKPRATRPKVVDPHRQQELYWKQLIELKVASCYMRRYRDAEGKWVTGIGTVRATASCGSIAGWALWQHIAIVWAVIIAASQVIDALKDVFPVAKNHKAAGALCGTLEHLFIDCQLEWEAVYRGRVTEREIMRQRHQLAKRQLDAEQRHFPDGLATDQKRFALAQADAASYIKNTYGVVPV